MKWILAIEFAVQFGLLGYGGYVQWTARVSDEALASLFYYGGGALLAPVIAVTLLIALFMK